MAISTMSRFGINDGLRVYYRHCKALKYCDRGIMEFLKNREISYVEFITRGCLVSLAATWNDAMVDRLINLAIDEANDGF